MIYFAEYEARLNDADFQLYYRDFGSFLAAFAEYCRCERGFYADELDPQYGMFTQAFG